MEICKTVKENEKKKKKINMNNLNRRIFQILQMIRKKLCKNELIRLASAQFSLQKS